MPRPPGGVATLPTHTVDYSEAQDGSDLEVYRYSEAKINFLGSEDEGVSEYKTWGENEDLTEQDWPHVLIDGYHRFYICTRFEIPFDVIKKEFENRDDVIEWIIKNQFGRRNLSDYQRGVLALRMKPMIETRAAQKRIDTQGRPETLRQNSDAVDQPNIRTDEVVSDMANISRDTIRKIEQIKNTAALEVQDLAAAGDVSINLAAQFALLPEEVQQEALVAIAERSEPAQKLN